MKTAENHAALEACAEALRALYNGTTGKYREAAIQRLNAKQDRRGVYANITETAVQREAHRHALGLAEAALTALDGA